MATQADDVVKGGMKNLPSELQEGADHVSKVCKEGFAKLESAPEDDPIHTVHKNHGLHAYRYEIMPDGSSVVLYANDPAGKVKMKAFDTHEEASQWSPREEHYAQANAAGE